VRNLADELRGMDKKVRAVVFDGVISQRLLDIAEKKGIEDGDTIRIFNNLGEFYAMAKVSSSCPPDGLVMEHGWEPYMYKFKKGHNEVVPTALNLLEMADGWGHLKFGGLWDGNQYAYDGAIDFEKANV